MLWGKFNTVKYVVRLIPAGRDLDVWFEDEYHLQISFNPQKKKKSETHQGEVSMRAFCLLPVIHAISFLDE